MSETMKAGRELDAMIAEKVMGFTYDHVVSETFWEDRMYGPEVRGGLWVVRASDGFVKYGEKLPHYSTDIAAAWLVVEKMRERGFDFTLRHFVTYTMTFVWDLGDRRESADSDLAPHAICLASPAALAALPSSTR